MKFVMLKLMQFILEGKAFNNNCIAKLCDGCFFCLYTHAELQQLIIATFCCLQNYFKKMVLLTCQIFVPHIQLQPTVWDTLIYFTCSLTLLFL